MNLYELNQIEYAKLPDMTEAQLQIITYKLSEFLKKINSSFYMMVEPEGRYYTLYTYIKNKVEFKLAQEIIDVAKTLGDIKDIEILQDRVEFWIKPSHEEICKVFLLFDYTKGVIQV